MSDDDEEDLDLDDEPLDLSQDKVCDLSGTYCWTLCPHCKVKNWVYLGRMDDQTAPDVEAVRCHKCSKVSWLDSIIREEASINGTTLDDAFVKEGKPQP
jgi:phage FluMu protein Com